MYHHGKKRLSSFLVGKNKGAGGGEDVQNFRKDYCYTVHALLPAGGRIRESLQLDFL